MRGEAKTVSGGRLMQTVRYLAGGSHVDATIAGLNQDRRDGIPGMNIR